MNGAVEDCGKTISDTVLQTFSSDVPTEHASGTADPLFCCHQNDLYLMQSSHDRVMNFSQRLQNMNL